ncbi:beta-lactamase-like protein [Lentinula raphanica]|nr:beta-lactamase-like protein [Lentinula raphanica]
MTSTPQVPYVSVFALIAGHLYLPHKEIFQDVLENGLETGGEVVPTFSFMIEHPTRGKYLFDLGLRKHAEGYPPALNDTLSEFKPQCDKDVAEILRENHINPNEIRGIMFSHLHFDHTGDVQPFHSAEIIVGGEAKVLFDQPVYPTDPDSPFNEWPEGRSVRYLEFKETLPFESHSKYLPSYFKKTNDFFGDGSFLLIDAPGHFPGHLAALARVTGSIGPSEVEDSSSPNLETYILLAGDCCHDRQCYTVVPPNLDIRQISEANHDDIEEARATVASLIHVVKEFPNLVIILAHEKEYQEEGMPFLPDSLNHWVVDRVRTRLTDII